MEVVGWFLQGFFLLVFFVWGYTSGKRSALSQVKDPSVCSCGHNYSVHKNDGTCNVAKLKEINYIKKFVNCACVRYDGVPPAHIYLKD